MYKSGKIKKTYGHVGRYIPVVTVEEMPQQKDDPKIKNNSLNSTLDSSYMDDTFDKMRKDRYYTHCSLFSMSLFDCW